MHANSNTVVWGNARSRISLRSIQATFWLALLACSPASAHNRSASYSTWQPTEQGIRAELRLPTTALNTAGLDPHDTATGDILASRLQSEFIPASGAAPCTALTASARRSGTLFIVQGEWRCAGAVSQIKSTFLLDRVPGHLHLLQVHSASGLQGPFALSASQGLAQITADAEPAPPEFGAYLRLGTGHILSGWDHLAFLLVLLLGAASLRQLVWRVSGFTLGHSLTLVLATLGTVRPPALMVEAFIALTIACTAAERLLAGHPRAVPHGAAIATVLALAGWGAGALPFALVPAALLLSLGAQLDARLDGLRISLFGLFHGFGFAGVLGSLSAAQAVPPLPLFGFNLGVELGQLLFVLPLWLLARRWPALHSPAVPAAVLALGAGWLAYRII